MVGFRIHPPEDAISQMALGRFMAELDGFLGYEIDEESGLPIACFLDEETAQTAQWMLDMNGAKGV